MPTQKDTLRLIAARAKVSPREPVVLDFGEVIAAIRESSKHHKDLLKDLRSDLTDIAPHFMGARFN